ncbi:protein tyrosine phosphatase [Patellaria atrata CBS 101060]|uniref:Very-long-chain (3R)-3-hydroxyacyl-CoA dehydratase n=1 Tax=Patellaria atrata CBS 101060 TaxID=1346257 RepID=A0A9P4S8Q5_9PEZI|nr:protein tyrosine phosphatase [Patellaria atrata CBS 101060]
MSTAQPPPAKSSSGARNAYLIAYNALSTMLWTSVLSKTVTTITTKGAGSVFSETGEWAKTVQTGAVLEVLHCLVGLVRAPLVTTGMQVASRLLLVWGIGHQFPQAVGGSPAYASMLVAWACSEVIRYPYFVFNLLGDVPGLVEWLRYNAFFVLYPMGIASECWLIFQAIEPASRQNPLFGYGLWAILATYVPGAYILYTHMMAQRRRIMRGKGRAKMQ